MKIRGKMSRKNKPENYKNIFDYILRYKKENDGNSPSMKEIAEALKIKGQGLVKYYIEGLIFNKRLYINKNDLVCIPGGVYSVKEMNKNGE